jgi:hypothetical protein
VGQGSSSPRTRVLGWAALIGNVVGPPLAVIGHRQHANWLRLGIGLPAGWIGAAALPAWIWAWRRDHPDRGSIRTRKRERQLLIALVGQFGIAVIDQLLPATTERRLIFDLPPSFVVSGLLIAWFISWRADKRTPRPDERSTSRTPVNPKTRSKRRRDITGSPARSVAVSSEPVVVTKPQPNPRRPLPSAFTLGLMQRQGNSMASIAFRYGVSEDEVRQAMGLTS